MGASIDSLLPVSNMFKGPGWAKDFASGRLGLLPIVNSDCKPEPSNYPALATFGVNVDEKPQSLEPLLAVITVYRTITTARLQSELTMGRTQ